MSEFGWTRLAYLTATLVILAVLVKLGTLGASSLPEDLPKSVFAFAQQETPVEKQYRDEMTSEVSSEETSKESPKPPEEAARADEGDEGDDHEDHEHSREPVEGLYENVNFEEDPPVFYRPEPRAGSASRGPSSTGLSGEKLCQNVSDAPPGSEIVFPLTREHFDSYDDTWGAARPQGGHEGTDLMVPAGTPLLALTDARVVPVSGASSNGWNTLGGYTVMLEAAYSVGPVKKGDLFYYAHMDEKSELSIGETVEVGDVVGYAGDTGQGPEGTRGQFPSHLHLGWYETSGERTQLASGAMNPYPLLEWIKANGGSIEGGSDVPYCEAPQSSAPTPSNGGYWQFPSDPGVRPDMSTGTNEAAPSPVVQQSDSSEFSPDVPREERRPDPAPDENANNSNNAEDRGNGPDEQERPENPGRPDVSERPESPNLPVDIAPLIPNPLPGISDIIGSILNPKPAKPPQASPAPDRSERPNRPNRPNRLEPPREDSKPSPPAENTETTTPPETTEPETTRPGKPEEECETDERPDERESTRSDTDEETRPEAEDCKESTTPEEPEESEEADGPESTTSEEETTVSPDDAAGDQYKDESSQTESSEPSETTSDS